MRSLPMVMVQSAVSTDIGIDGVKGILEYPLLRKTKEVILTDVDLL